MTAAILDEYRWRLRYHWRRFQRTPVYWGGRDLANVLRHGRDAPRFAELVWMTPTDCRRKLPNDLKGFERHDSGRIECRDWPYDAALPLDEDPIVAECLAHWVDGVAWPETGAIDRMRIEMQRKGVSKNARTIEEIHRYCAWLDALFDEVARTGRLRTQHEVTSGNGVRERGGIIVHVGPDGELFKGSDGHHRFAIALVLGLRSIPAQLGVVHRRALPLLPALRRDDERVGSVPPPP